MSATCLTHARVLECIEDAVGHCYADFMMQSAPGMVRDAIAGRLAMAGFAWVAWDGVTPCSGRMSDGHHDVIFQVWERAIAATVDGRRSVLDPAHGWDEYHPPP